MNEGGLMDALLLDFPESFELDRLTIRTPHKRDGTEIHAAVRSGNLR